MKNPRKAIAYYRASTNEEIQANSFGVQQHAVEQYAGTHGYKIVQSFAEYVSASKNVVRTEWNAALDYLRDNPDTTLIIQKIDRATRSLRDWSEIEDLLSLIRFTNFPDSEPNILLVSILISVAQAESRAISNRTALAIQSIRRQAEKRGEDFKWGNPQNLDSAASKKGRDAHADIARVFSAQIAAHVAGRGTTLKEKAQYLNERRIRTRTGKRWSVHSLHRVLKYKESSDANLNLVRKV